MVTPGGLTRRLDRHGLIHNAATVAGFSVLFGGVSLLREQATAQAFGSGAAAEAFVVAYALVNFLISTIAGILGPVFTPLFLQIRHRESAHEARRFAAAALGACVLSSVSLCLALALTSDRVLRLFAAGFDAPRLALASDLTYLLLPAIVFSSTAYLWTALLNADRRFAIAGFGPTLQPLGALIGLLAGSGERRVHAMAIGLTVGAAAHAALLAWAAVRAGHDIRLALPRPSPWMRTLATQYGANFLGSILMGATVLVNQGMATLVSNGAVAHLAFGGVAVTFALGLGARTVGQVLLPRFGQLAAEARWADLRADAGRALRITFALGTSAAVVLAVAAGPIVRLMFERGAFTAADTAAVAALQRYLALQVPWYIGGIVTARLLTTLQMTPHMLWIAGVGLMLTVAVNVLLIEPFGVNGIAMGVVFVYAVCFSISWWLARRRLDHLAAAGRMAHV